MICKQKLLCRLEKRYKSKHTHCTTLQKKTNIPIYTRGMRNPMKILVYSFLKMTEPMYLSSNQDKPAHNVHRANLVYPLWDIIACNTTLKMRSFALATRPILK